MTLLGSVSLGRVENAQEDLPTDTDCAREGDAIAEWHKSKVYRLDQRPKLPVGDQCSDIDL